MNSSFNDRSNLLYRKDINQNDYNTFINKIQRSRLSFLDLSTELEIIFNNRNKSYVQCLALENIEYRYFLSGTTNGTIQLFDLFSRNSTLDLTASKNQIKPCLEYIDSFIDNGSSVARVGMISSIQWYPEDTGVFVTSNMNGKIAVFDTNTFTPVMSFSFSNNQVYCTRIRPYNPDLIATGLSDGTVRLCDPRTHDTSHVLNGHTRAVSCIEWSPQCTHHLISSDMNGAIHTWDVRKAGINAIVKSFDWREDFSISKQPISTNTVSSTTSIHRFAASRAHDSAVMSLSCTSCGRYLLSSGNDGKLRLWNMNTGKLLPVKYNNYEDLQISNNINSNNNCIVPISSLPYTSLIAEFSSPSDDVIIIPRATNLKLNSNQNTSNNINEGDIMMIPLHQPLHGKQSPARVLKGHLDRVTSMIYRKPYQQLITAAKDGMLFVWDPKQIKKSSLHHEMQVHYKSERYDYQQVLNGFSKFQSSYSRNNIHGNYHQNEENSYSSEDNWSNDDENDEMKVNDTNKEHKTIPFQINNNHNISKNNKRSFIPPIIQKYLEDAKLSLQRERQLSSIILPPPPSSPSTTTIATTTTWSNIDQLFTSNDHYPNNNMDQQVLNTSQQHQIFNENQVHNIETSQTSRVQSRPLNNINQDNQYKNWIKRLKTKKK